FGSLDGLIAQSQDHVRFGSEQVGHERGQPVEPTLGIAVVDDQILTFDPSEVAESLDQRGRQVWRGAWRKATNPADAVQLSCLLRPTRERRGEQDEREDDCQRRTYDHRTTPSNYFLYRPMYPGHSDATQTCVARYPSERARRSAVYPTPDVDQQAACCFNTPAKGGVNGFHSLDHPHRGIPARRLIDGGT